MNKHRHLLTYLLVLVYVYWCGGHQLFGWRRQPATDCTESGHIFPKSAKDMLQNKPFVAAMSSYPKITTVLALYTWASAGFFPGVDNEGVWKTEVPQQGPGAAPRWGSGAKPPEADDIFSKWCINTSSTEVLDYICSKKKHFSTFPGKASAPLEGGIASPLPMPADTHGFTLQSPSSNRNVHIQMIPRYRQQI